MERQTYRSKYGLTLLQDHDDTCDIWRPFRLDEHLAVPRPRRMDALATFKLSGKTSDIRILLRQVFVHVNVRSLEHSPILQNVHFRLPVDKPDDDGRLVSLVFRFQEVTRRDLPLVYGDAFTREETHDLILHILKILLSSCVWRFSCIPMCSRTRIRGVSHKPLVTCALQARFKLTKDPTSAIRKCNLSSLLQKIICVRNNMCPLI